MQDPASYSSAEAEEHERWEPGHWELHLRVLLVVLLQNQNI